MHAMQSQSDNDIALFAVGIDIDGIDALHDKVMAVDRLCQAIEKVVKCMDLTEAETRKVFEEIMSGKADKEDVKEFLLSLKAKGESPGEIAAAAKGGGT